MRTTRLEAFSDGVFEIAITLLVFEVRVLEAEPGRLAEALLPYPASTGAAASSTPALWVWRSSARP